MEAPRRAWVRRSLRRRLRHGASASQGPHRRLPAHPARDRSGLGGAPVAGHRGHRAAADLHHVLLGRAAGGLGTVTPDFPHERRRAAHVAGSSAHEGVSVGAGATAAAARRAASGLAASARLGGVVRSRSPGGQCPVRRGRRRRRVPAAACAAATGGGVAAVRQHRARCVDDGDGRRRRGACDRLVGARDDRRARRRGGGGAGRVLAGRVGARGGRDRRRGWVGGRRRWWHRQPGCTRARWRAGLRAPRRRTGAGGRGGIRWWCCGRRCRADRSGRSQQCDGRPARFAAGRRPGHRRSDRRLPRCPRPVRVRRLAGRRARHRSGQARCAPQPGDGVSATAAPPVRTGRGPARGWRPAARRSRPPTARQPSTGTHARSRPTPPPACASLVGPQRRRRRTTPPHCRGWRARTPPTRWSAERRPRGAPARRGWRTRTRRCRERWTCDRAASSPRRCRAQRAGADRRSARRCGCAIDRRAARRERAGP